jgi:putative nucleotidyltransferase with HDIG domain
MEVIKKKNLNFYSFGINEQTECEKSLFEFLKFINKEKYSNHLSYILSELVANAEKANLKRIHFIKEELDITSIHDYHYGMLNFKTKLSLCLDEYREQLKKNNFYISVDLLVDDNKFSFKVTNNNTILPIELMKMQEMKAIAARFNSIEDVFSRNLDNSEAGGFGITIIVLMLRQMELLDSNFEIADDSNETRVQVSLPLNILNKKEAEIISEDVVREINDIPQFPQHITELLNLLDNPESNFEIISNKIKKDPALIADLIKIANSPLYLTAQKINSIDEAVRIIGFKNMRNFILSYATNKIFINKYNINEIKDVINHSSEVAYYAVETAKLFKYKDFIERVFICGMLHDFGKIILKAIKPEIINKVKDLALRKGININILESLTSGYNHSIIGYELAKKWNFPDFIQESIKYHHIPLQTSDENLAIVSIVYFADRIYYYKHKEINYSDINFNVLKSFNLSNVKDFELVSQSIIMKYENYFRK